MIRLSFNKIEFLQSTTATQVVLEIQTQDSERFKLKPKRIKNKLARFYGEFVELETNNIELKLKIYIIEQGKVQNLVQKLQIKKNSYGYNQKKSHFISGIKLKIWFDSENLNGNDSGSQQSQQDVSNVIETAIINERMSLMKIWRGFSPDQKQIIQRYLSPNGFKNSTGKNITMRIDPKSTFKGVKLINN